MKRDSSGSFGIFCIYSIIISTLEMFLQDYDLLYFVDQLWIKYVIVTRHDRYVMGFAIKI